MALLAAANEAGRSDTDVAEAVPVIRAREDLHRSREAFKESSGCAEARSV